MSDAGLVLVGLAIAVGIAGVVVPVLPGALLVWAAILVWALAESTATAWGVFALATGATGGAQVVKYLVPGRRLRDAGVPRRSMVAGVVLAIVGFFVVPVVGLFLFFAGAVFLVELARRRDAAVAWTATRAALKATLITIGVQLAGGVVATLVWVVGLVVT